MNILKLYDTHEKAIYAFNEFARINDSVVSEKNRRNMRIELVRGAATIDFRTASEYPDVQKLSGNTYNIVDLDTNSYFDDETEHFIVSRIRWVNK